MPRSINWGRKLYGSRRNSEAHLLRDAARLPVFRVAQQRVSRRLLREGSVGCLRDYPFCYLGDPLRLATSITALSPLAGQIAKVRNGSGADSRLKAESRLSITPCDRNRRIDCLACLRAAAGWSGRGRGRDMRTVRTMCTMCTPDFPHLRRHGGPCRLPVRNGA